MRGGERLSVRACMVASVRACVVVSVHDGATSKVLITLDLKLACPRPGQAVRGNLLVYY